MDSATAIQPNVIGPAEQCVDVDKQLQAKGFKLGAIRPPTVPANSSRLRITLSAAHSREQVDSLLNALQEVLCH